MRLYQVTLAISITFRIKFNLGTRMLNETRYVRMNFLPHCNVIQRVTLPNTSTMTNGFVIRPHRTLGDTSTGKRIGLP